MKQIKIIHFNNSDKNSIYKRDHYYSVLLGNDVKRTFSDRKKLEQFFVRVNADLNICLVEIINIYNDVHRFYWQTWFYDYPGNDSINKIEPIIKIAVERSDHTNGNYFVFVHLFNVLNSLDDITKELHDVRSKKNHYAEVRQLNVMLYRINNCRFELTQIGVR